MAMFSTIKNMWKEARADVASKEAADAIERYNRLDGFHRYEMTSAFDYTKNDLELEHGMFDTWQVADKAAVAEQLMKTARAGLKESPSGAMGLALLSLYLEAQTLPGVKAVKLAADIAAWHRAAAQRDIKKV
jgi:hypothetical protein